MKFLVIVTIITLALPFYYSLSCLDNNGKLLVNINYLGNDVAWYLEF